MMICASIFVVFGLTYLWFDYDSGNDARNVASSRNVWRWRKMLRTSGGCSFVVLGIAVTSSGRMERSLLRN